jgi:pyrophosphatase PpaX
MTGYEPILLDLDGTVIDTVALIRESHRHAVRTVLGREMSDEQLVSQVGRPLIEQMQVFSPEHADELFRVYREWNHANTAALIASYDGIDGVLAALKADGRTLGIVTSKSRDAVDLAFASIPIEHYFDVVITADDSTLHKPNAEPVLAGFEALGRSLNGGCYVGDAPFDLQAAAAAGVAGIGVTWGFFPRSALEAEKPRVIVDTPEELLSTLRGA